jgi:tRNA threonylcarbamoyl adenosine modification protein (Sua5/YciO/YrdC/YwlC family)
MIETKLIKIDNAKIDTMEIKKAAELIDAGGLVAFPTETVYGIACRVKKDSLDRLDDLKGRSPDKYYTLHIDQKDNMKKYVPTIGLRALKLVRNAWPGPLTVVFELNQTDIDEQRNNLPDDVFEGLYKNNSIGIRCPDNPVAQMLLGQANNPVVAPSANITGEAPAITAQGVLEQLSSRIELVLDAGTCKYRNCSTVVKTGKKGLEILRPGVYSQAELEILSQINFLMVCTGNTCRSPMAEGIFRKYLAEKLQSSVEHLGKMGYIITSAGTIGSAGYPASPEAVAACAAKGINIGDHRNKGLSRELIEKSDFIFTMERIHRDMVVALDHEAANRCFLLAGDKEIPDPIGQSQNFYNNCARLIEKAVKERISELVL